jgi:hypothetical protein
MSSSRSLTGARGPGQSRRAKKPRRRSRRRHNLRHSRLPSAARLRRGRPRHHPASSARRGSGSARSRSCSAPGRPDRSICGSAARPRDEPSSPFFRHFSAISASRSLKITTRCHFVRSLRSPDTPSRQLSEVATARLAMRLPSCIERISGSRPRLPTGVPFVDAAPADAAIRVGAAGCWHGRPGTVAPCPAPAGLRLVGPSHPGRFGIAGYLNVNLLLVGRDFVDAGQVGGDPPELLEIDARPEWKGMRNRLWRGRLQVAVS